MIDLVYFYRLLRPGNLPLLAALLLLIVSIMMPPIDLDQQTHDIQITFDISQSMNVRDVGGVGDDSTMVSRLNLAKVAAGSLLANLPCGSHVGWSVFSGQRSITLVTPLDVCLHYAGLLLSLDKIDGRMRWIEASSIGKGLHQSMRAAKSIGDGTSIIFISDGHEAPPLRLGQKGIPDTRKLDVKGLIVGVGGETASRIPKSDKEGRVTGYWQAEDVVQQSSLPKGQGREHLSRLHTDHLIKLAQLTNLTYLELDSDHAILEALNNAEYSNMKSTPIDLGWVPALLAMIALCWRFMPFREVVALILK